MSAETVQGWVPVDDFGTRLLIARKYADLTVREAADRCGVHYATWSTWERGAQPANMAGIVQKISKGLGVDRDWLMWGGPLADQTRVPSVTEQYPSTFFRLHRASRRERTIPTRSPRPATLALVPPLAPASGW